MKNKHFKKRKTNEKFRSKIKNIIKDMDCEELIESDENLYKLSNIINKPLSDEETEIIFDVFRQRRIKEFFKKLNIENEKFKSTSNKVIKINPSNDKLISLVYRKHKGNYKISTLIEEFHDAALSEGNKIGIRYGAKFAIEDLQNKRFTKEDFENMTEDEIIEYCNEIRNEI